MTKKIAGKCPTCRRAIHVPRAGKQSQYQRKCKHCRAEWQVTVKPAHSIDLDCRLEFSR